LFVNKISVGACPSCFLQKKILRPEGTVIIRDTVEVLEKVQAIAEGMRWKNQIMDHEPGPFNPRRSLSQSRLTGLESRLKSNSSRLGTCLSAKF
jgi:hypothetical protein